MLRQWHGINNTLMRCAEQTSFSLNIIDADVGPFDIKDMWRYSQYTYQIQSELQTIPTSSWWPQLWGTALLGQSCKVASLPIHCTLSNQIFPVPIGNEWLSAVTTDEYPNCLQTISASVSSQSSSHTVPHRLLWKTSIRPSFFDEPPTSRTERFNI